MKAASSSTPVITGQSSRLQTTSSPSSSSGSNEGARPSAVSWLAQDRHHA
eukprot:NODE_3202_length_964_cov_33.046995_g1702_i3.p2 GENE.NODE_3202_length_964_cov_33.046995_g1702_i3~~NODE_3202_length_964_cov_33.046995_g1702_i3.p2  ORF type:complete len:50 (+),score=8.18 NODE_3202_length_964_cov_33.046995_g1702_i3:405-554(+)